MTLPLLLIGIVCQLMFAGFQFMLVVFSGGGIANGRTLEPMQSTILNTSMWALPALSISVCVLEGVLYVMDAGPWAYAWHLLPVAACGMYLAYALSLAG